MQSIQSYNTPVIPIALPLTHTFGMSGIFSNQVNFTLTPEEKPSYEAIDITKACKNKIAELKARNKEIQPKKVSLARLALISLASLLGVIAGAILVVAGIGLCCTGSALPAGVTLILGGFALLGVGIPLLRFFYGKIVEDNEVFNNQTKIKGLKELLQDRNFLDYAISFHKELGISHKAVETFALQYDIKKIFELHKIEEEGRLKEPRKRDPHELLFWDYTDYFNLLDKKVNIANNMLAEISVEIQLIESIVKKNSGLGQEKIEDLKERKKALLVRGQNLQKKRPFILKDVLEIEEMSIFAKERLESIAKAANLTFPKL